jgi:hypothetical protein
VRERERERERGDDGGEYEGRLMSEKENQRESDG